MTRRRLSRKHGSEYLLSLCSGYPQQGWCLRDRKTASQSVIRYQRVRADSTPVTGVFTTPFPIFVNSGVPGGSPPLQEWFARE
jgi:hypothetical protein